LGADGPRRISIAALSRIFVDRLVLDGGLCDWVVVAGNGVDQHCHMYRDDFLLRAPSGGRNSFEIFSNSVFRSGNLGFMARCANFENHTAGSGVAGGDDNRCDDRGLE
jgi:hypothetical protein